MAEVPHFFGQLSPRSRYFWLIAGIGIIASIALAYWQILSVGFLSDDYLLLAFAQIAPIDGSVFAVNPIRWLLFHRPFVLLIWQLMYATWGINPLPYHVLGLALHMLNSFLLMRLVLLIKPETPWSAIGAGVIFALLPVNVETVTWLACWFDLFALCAYLGTLLCLVLWWQRRQMGWLLLSIGIYQLAIWSKESTFTLPVLALLLGALLRPRPPIRRLLVSLFPYLLLLGVNVVQRYLVWGSIGGYEGGQKPPLVLLNNGIGAIGVLLAPLNQALMTPGTVQIVGIVSGVVLLLGVLTRAEWRLLLLGVGWVLSALLPTLNLLPIGTDLQNARLLYPAVVGYAIVLGTILGGLPDRLRPRYRQSAHVALLAAVGFASLIAVQLQTQPWVVATKATEMITKQVEQALPPARLGTILQIVDIPDNYQGAYMYRLGFDMALLTRDQQLYIQWPEHSPQPIPYRALNLKGDFFQARVKADAQRRRWEVVDVRGVTTDEPLDPFPKTHWIYGMQADRLITELAQRTPTPRPVVQQWDPQDCQAVKIWKSIDLAFDCQAGSGLVITPTGSRSVLSMPGVQIETDRWTEVVVKMETLAPTQQAVVKLFWGPRTEDLLNGGSLTIEVPDDPRRQNYHFFIPPSRDRKALKTLQLAPLNQAVPVRLLAIQVLQDR